MAGSVSAVSPPSEFMQALAGALAGALGGYVSALTLFPLDVIKTKQQSGAKDGMLKIARDIVRQDGPLGLWGKLSVVICCSGAGSDSVERRQTCCLLSLGSATTKLATMARCFRPSLTRR